MINNDLLSRLVTWAASDFLRGMNPAEAIALGIAKEGDKNLGSWRQSDWGQAKRNGHCETAFCIAGGASAVDEDYFVVMNLIYDGDGEGAMSTWNGSRVIARSEVPVGVGEEKFGYLWVNDEEYSSLEENNLLEGVSEHGQKVLGLDTTQADHLFSGGNQIENVVSLAYFFMESEGNYLNVPVWVLEKFNDPSLVPDYLRTSINA